MKCLFKLQKAQVRAKTAMKAMSQVRVPSPRRFWTGVNQRKWRSSSGEGLAEAATRGDPEL
jgi:hypothetical protein